jgi:hypothetical protein
VGRWGVDGGGVIWWGRDGAEDWCRARGNGAVGRGERVVAPHVGQERLWRRADFVDLRVDRWRRKEPHLLHAELSCGGCGGRSRVRAAWRAARGGEAAKMAGARARLNLSVGSMGVFAGICVEARLVIVLYIYMHLHGGHAFVDLVPHALALAQRLPVARRAPSPRRRCCPHAGGCSPGHERSRHLSSP